jgi:DNA polymerase-1
MLTLMGDTADNIPGAKGVGPKSAVALITQYGSLDGVLAHVHELTPKRREAIEEARALFVLGRKLVTLKSDCDVEVGIEDAPLKLHEQNREQVVELMRQLGFHRLKGEMDALLGGTPVAADQSNSAQSGGARSKPSATSGAESAQEKPIKRKKGADTGPSLFDAMSGDGTNSQTQAGVGPGPGAYVIDSSATRDGVYNMIATPEQLRAFVQQVRDTKNVMLAFDTETDSIHPSRAGLVGVSLCIAARTGVYIPVRSPEPESHMTWEQILPILKPLLEDASIAKTGHNAKFDIMVLARHSIHVAGLRNDTLISSHLIDAGRMSHGLDSLCEMLLGHRNISISSLIGSGKFQKTFDKVPLQLATEYAAEDADMSLRLHELFAPQIHDMGMDQLLQTLELPLVHVLAVMEQNGIHVDAQELDRQTHSPRATRKRLARASDATVSAPLQLGLSKATGGDFIFANYWRAAWPWLARGEENPDRRQHRR